MNTEEKKAVLNQAHKTAKRIASGLKPAAKRKAVKEWCNSMTAYIGSSRG